MTPTPSSREPDASKVAAIAAWRDAEAAVEQARGSKMFMGKPEAWFDDPHWFCANGHVSGNYLKSEERGELCLACKTPVILGPKIGEAAFAPILAHLLPQGDGENG